ncbi:MAG: hypothetical protein L7F78_09100 [Syntrophales bacterium LBB04]|nr:hypothetical protein [Syntrophales bacterium LBB04]
MKGINSITGSLVPTAGMPCREATTKQNGIFPRGDRYGQWRAYWQSFSVAFSPDGQYAASGSMDSTVKLWEVSTGREVWTRKADSTSLWVYSVIFSPNGQYVASGSDYDSRLWEISTGKEVWKLHAPLMLDSFAVSPDGRYVLLGSLHDPDVRLWEMSTDREVRTLKGHSGGVLSVASAMAGMPCRAVRTKPLDFGKLPPVRS